MLDFDNRKAAFGVGLVSGGAISAGHWALAMSEIYFNDGFNWFFHDVSNACTDGISPMGVAVAAAGTSQNVSVTAASGCAWTALSNDAWIAVTGERAEVATAP